MIRMRGRAKGVLQSSCPSLEERLRRLHVLRREGLAVAASGRVELDEQVLEVLDGLVVVLLGQHVDALVLLDLEVGLQLNKIAVEIYTVGSWKQYIVCRT